MQPVNTFVSNKLNLLFENQYLFRPGHSTEYAALELTDRVITDMDKNHVPLNVYLNLSKAFDTLNPNILLDILYYRVLWNSRNPSLSQVDKKLISRKTSICLILTCKIKHAEMIDRCSTGFNFRTIPFLNLYQ